MMSNTDTELIVRANKKAAYRGSGNYCFKELRLVAICTSTGGTAVAINTSTIGVTAFYILSAYTHCCC